MGRSQDNPGPSFIPPKEVNMSWEEILSLQRAGSSTSWLQRVGGWGSLSREQNEREAARSLERTLRARKQAGSHGRAASAHEPLARQVAHLQAKNAELHERLQRVESWLEAGTTSPVVALVTAGHIAEARQLVSLLLQATPSGSLANWSKVLAPPSAHADTSATGPSFTSNAAWLRANAGAYSGQWVALRDGTLLGADESRVRLQRALEARSDLAGATFVRL